MMQLCMIKYRMLHFKKNAEIFGRILYQYKQRNKPAPGFDYQITTCKNWYYAWTKKLLPNFVLFQTQSNLKQWT